MREEFELVKVPVMEDEDFTNFTLTLDDGVLRLTVADQRLTISLDPFEPAIPLTLTYDQARELQTALAICRRVISGTSLEPQRWQMKMVARDGS